MTKESGLCPICNTLWNTHNEVELLTCRLILDTLMELKAVRTLVAHYIAVSPVYANGVQFFYSLN